MAANVGVSMESLFGGFAIKRLVHSPLLFGLATDASSPAGMVVLTGARPTQRAAVGQVGASRFARVVVQRGQLRR